MPDRESGLDRLEGAYRLRSPQDARAFYAGFAQTYDSDFAAGLGWHYPRAVAGVWRSLAAPQDLPVADIGCGTGCVAEALGLDPGLIDGFDISPEMLARARDKRLYRALHEVDLTGPLDRLPRGYGTVISAGTFTHGHLGPDALEPLLGLARPGGLFVIGVNQQHFRSGGFAALLDRLQGEGRIAAASIRTVQIYDRPGHAHSADQAEVLGFRTAGPG
jgi:predicted TPR repeat methyltransferase